MPTLSNDVEVDELFALGACRPPVLLAEAILSNDAEVVDVVSVPMVACSVAATGLRAEYAASEAPVALRLLGACVPVVLFADAILSNDV